MKYKLRACVEKACMTKDGIQMWKASVRVVTKNRSFSLDELPGVYATKTEALHAASRRLLAIVQSGSPSNVESE